MDEVDVLETVTGAPSDKKAAKEEEIKIKEEEKQLQIQPPLKQQVENLFFSNKSRLNFIMILVDFNIGNNRN